MNPANTLKAAKDFGWEPIACVRRDMYEQSTGMFYEMLLVLEKDQRYMMFWTNKGNSRRSLQITIEDREAARFYYKTSGALMEELKMRSQLGNAEMETYREMYGKIKAVLQ